MYPYLRTFLQVARARRKPALNHPFEECKINMRVLPWDIDPFMELNNGRYLTLMDIGRTDVAERLGLPKVLKKKKWGLMVGAVSSRYRRRLKPFEKFTLHSQIQYYDHRWVYFRQWFTSNDEQKVHASFLVRTAVTSKQGLVPTDQVMEAMGFTQEMLAEYNYESDWIKQWVKSDEIHRTIMEEPKI